MEKEIIIGVIGHRDLIEEDQLITNINKFFEMLRQKHPHKKIILLSPLADGADRLVARQFLAHFKNHKPSKLIVPMPFDRERYMEDFDASSKKEFQTLLNASTKSFQVPSLHQNGYLDVGRYVVDHVDILLALWDGTFNGKVGGTGDIVNYAKEQGVEVEHLLTQRNSL